MPWDGWENETEESIKRRREGEAPGGIRAPETDPAVDGFKLSQVKGAVDKPRRGKGENQNEGHADLHRSGGRGGGKGRDRGSRQGARWVVVDAERRIVEWALAQQHKTQGRKFQSVREAKRYIGLLGRRDRGEIRNLRLQVDWPLYAVRPDGLKERVCNYRCDFVFDELLEDGTWKLDVVEDAKGWKQDAYLLKSKWFAIQYGFPIRET